jgi:hypothetical protein
MEIWEVEEDHLIALIHEINRLGQSLLEFDEEEYAGYFSSRLAEITLGMMGIDGTSADPAGGDGISGDGVKNFDAGPYSYLFNSEVFLNENLIGEIMAGIRQNSEGFYKPKAQTAETGSSVIWKIEERQLIDLIQEINRLGRVMGKVDYKSYDTYFATDLPDIILKMLGIPEDYSGIPYEDYVELVKPGDDDNETEEETKHPAAYSRSYDYDMFRYKMGDETIKKFLDYKRKHRDEYRRIRAEQAKLGDKLYKPDGYDGLYDAMIELLKNKKN